MTSYKNIAFPLHAHQQRAHESGDERTFKAGAKMRGIERLQERFARRISDERGSCT